MNAKRTAKPRTVNEARSMAECPECGETKEIDDNNENLRELTFLCLCCHHQWDAIEK